MGDNINRVRYTVDNIMNSRFYQMPKFLFEDEFAKMSNDARVLYSLLRDRHELSIKNNWINENNEVYLIYTRKDMEDMLGLSDKTTKKAVDQLIKFDLIDEERKGQGKPNYIFLKAVILGNTLTRRNSDSRKGDITILDSENLRPIDTDFSDTDFSDTIFHSNINDYINISMNFSENEREKESNKTYINEFNTILNNCNYNDFEEKYINSILQAIRLLYYSDKPLKINSMSIPPTQVREDLKILRWKHIELGLRDFLIQAKTQDIQFPVGYLSRCIYNAIFQGDLKIQSELLYKGLV